MMQLRRLNLGFSYQMHRLFVITVFRTNVSTPEVSVKSPTVKGDTWAIHKFGGTCVGTAQRIQNVANIVMEDGSKRKLVVLSAMSKVIDMIYDLIEKAQSRDDSYECALDAVFEKHKLTAVELLDGDELASFLSTLTLDINNLKAMLHTIYIARHGTESFSAFVAGHFMFCSNIVISPQKGWDRLYMDGHEGCLDSDTCWF